MVRASPRVDARGFLASEGIDADAVAQRMGGPNNGGLKRNPNRLLKMFLRERAAGTRF